MSDDIQRIILEALSAPLPDTAEEVSLPEICWAVRREHPEASTTEILRAVAVLIDALLALPNSLSPITVIRPDQEIE